MKLSLILPIRSILSLASVLKVIGSLRGHRLLLLVLVLLLLLVMLLIMLVLDCC